MASTHPLTGFTFRYNAPNPSCDEHDGIVGTVDGGHGDIVYLRAGRSHWLKVSTKHLTRVDVAGS